MSLIDNISNFIFGYDYFISYAHSDGRKYALELCNKLEERRYVVFLDSKEYQHGANWRIDGRRALAKSKFLILVGTPNALKSIPVCEEVNYFATVKDTTRKIIPIDLNQAIANAGDANTLKGILTDDVLTIRDNADIPSSDTVHRINVTYKLKRQTHIRRNWIAVAAFILTALTTLSILLAFVSHRNAQKEAIARSKAEQRLYFATIHQASYALEMGHFDQARQLVLSVDSSQRNWEWAFLLARCGPSPRQVDQKFLHSIPVEFQSLKQYASSVLDTCHVGDERFRVAQISPDNAMDGSQYAKDSSDDDPSSLDDKWHKSISDDSLGNKIEALGQNQANNCSGFVFDREVSSTSGVRFEWIPCQGHPGGAGILYNASNKILIYEVLTGTYGEISHARLSDDGTALAIDVHIDKNACDFAFTTQGDFIDASGVWLFSVPTLYTEPGLQQYNDQESYGFTHFDSLDQWASPAVRTFVKKHNSDNNLFKVCKIARLSGREYALCAIDNGLIQIYDVNENRVVKSFGDSVKSKLDPLDASRDTLVRNENAAISNNGKLLFACPLMSDFSGSLYSYSSGKLLRKARNRVNKNYKLEESGASGQSSIWFSPKDTYVVFAYTDRNEHHKALWETSTMLPVDWYVTGTSGIGWDSTETFRVVQSGRITSIFKHGKLVRTYTSMSLGDNESGFEDDRIEDDRINVMLSPDGSRLLVGRYLLDSTSLDLVLELPIGTTLNSDWSRVTIPSNNLTKQTIDLKYWASAKEGRWDELLNFRDQLLQMDARSAAEKSACLLDLARN